jgi:hypothetical protein
VGAVLCHHAVLDDDDLVGVADGIRDYGNEMAHGDFTDPVAGADSALIIQLMGEILDEVYQSPADSREFSKRSMHVSWAAVSPASAPQPRKEPAQAGSAAATAARRARRSA